MKTKRFSRIREQICRFSLTFYQFIILALFSILALAAVSVYEYHKTLDIEKEKLYRDTENELHLADVLIDNHMSAVQRIIYTNSTRKDIYESDDQVAAELLSEMSKEIFEINSIFIIKDNGAIVSSEQLQYEIRGNECVEQALKKAENHPGKMLWSEPYVSTTVGTSSICISYRDIKTGHTLAVEVNFKKINQDVSSTLKKKMQSYVIDSAAGMPIIYDEANYSLYQKCFGVKKANFAQNLDKLVEVVKRYSDKPFRIKAVRGVFFMENSDNIPGWVVTAIIDDDARGEIYASAGMHLLRTLVIGIITVIFSMLAIVLFFTRRIRKLAGIMEHVQDFNSLVVIKNGRQDEVGRLTDSYNRLVVKVHQLLEDVVEAEQKKILYEFRMYQSQIGPHFLHNTLYCISSLIRTNRYAEANRALQSLGALLSYSFDSSASAVNLQMEIDSIIKYIEIMKMRYGDTFAFEMRVSPSLSDMQVPKMILQPLIENTLIHAIPALREGEGRVVLRAYVYKTYVSLLVADNGCGIPEDKLKDLLTVKNEEHKRDRYSSIGIANVNERIKMYYHSKEGIRIRSKSGIGTVIRMVFPKNR